MTTWHVVERQFTGAAWDPDTTPWREIAVTTGPDSYEDAVRFARLQTTNYTHPARYRVLAVVELDVFERPAEVGPLGPDDGLCRCTDSVRSALGTCPRPGDREYGHCPKRAGQAALRPMELLVLRAMGGPGEGKARTPGRPLIEILAEEDEAPPPRPRTSSLVDETPRDWED